MTRYYCNVGHMDVEKQIRTTNKLAIKYGVTALPENIIRTHNCLQFTWYSGISIMMYRDMTYDYTGVEVSVGVNNLGRM